MKIFNATVAEGNVLVNGMQVPSCPILGEGGNSSGFVVMAEDKLVYLPKTSPDLSKTLEYISLLINTIATNIFQKNGGGDITTQAFVSELAEIKNQIDLLKEQLR